MSYYTLSLFGVCCVEDKILWALGDKGRTQHHQTSEVAKQEIFIDLFIDLCRFLKKKISMVKFKMSSVPVLFAKQEVPEVTCLKLIDLCRLHRNGVSWDAEHYGESHSVVNSCYVRQTGSASQHFPYRFCYMKFPGIVLFWTKSRQLTMLKLSWCIYIASWSLHCQLFAEYHSVIAPGLQLWMCRGKYRSVGKVPETSTTFTMSWFQWYTKSITNEQRRI